MKATIMMKDIATFLAALLLALPAALLAAMPAQPNCILPPSSRTATTPANIDSFTQPPRPKQRPPGDSQARAIAVMAVNAVATILTTVRRVTISAGETVPSHRQT